jgi:hypothetical protein
VVLWQKMAAVSKGAPAGIPVDSPVGQDRISQMNSTWRKCCPLYARSKGVSVDALPPYRSTAIASRLACPPQQPRLPMRDGVAPSYLWLPEGQWPGHAAFLSRYPRSAPRNGGPHGARRSGRWRGRRAAAGQRVRRGMRIFYYRELERETPIPFKEDPVQDEHLVVVDKPHFLPMTPGGASCRRPC